jgi:hypothetical protein
MVLYVRLDGGRFDRTATSFRGPGIDPDGARVAWTVPQDLRTRDVYFSLIRRQAEYTGHGPPYACDGLSFSWPFGLGYLRVADGLAQIAHYSKDVDRINVTWFHLVLPNWLLLVVVGLIPAVFVVRPGVRYLTRSRHPTRGRCSRCGYDLRATPCQCPECGLHVASAPATSDEPEGEACGNNSDAITGAAK